MMNDTVKRNRFLSHKANYFKSKKRYQVASEKLKLNYTSATPEVWTQIRKQVKKDRKRQVTLDLILWISAGILLTLFLLFFF